MNRKEQPSTRYTKSGGFHIAYQVVGEDPPDIVFLPGMVSNLDSYWESALSRRFFRRLASIGRTVLFDKRSTGLSDRIPDDTAPTVEERIDDVRAVMDAVGLERVALVGLSEGGSIAAVFAATYPARTTRLVLVAPLVRPAGLPPVEEGEELAASWGNGHLIDRAASSLADNDDARRAFARFERAAASPGTLRHMLLLNARIDITGILPLVPVPTLVVHRTGDRLVNIEDGRIDADLIPEARFVELPGHDHLPWVGDIDALLDPIDEFLTGTPAEVRADRALATVLFSDIVGSTRRAAALGDRRWHSLLDQHDALLQQQVKRFAGRHVRSTGDGCLATFDGPTRALRCAAAIVAAVEQIGPDVRVGVHVGECEVRGDDVGGVAVHTAARVCDLAAADEILATRTVSDLVAGSGISFDDRGVHELEGVPGRWELVAAIP